MKKSIILTAVLLLILGVFIAGCTSNTSSSSPSPAQTTTSQPSSVQTTASQLSTIDPSHMALTLSDVPTGFTMKMGTERTSSDVSQTALADGWKKGYYVEFDKTNTAIRDYEVLQQTISIYPINNLNQVMTEASTSLLKEANATITVEQLSDPKIGDSSKAFRIKSNILGMPVTKFSIYYVKKDVFEGLSMGGTSADYETLKQLANVSASKII
ncbi:MAG: hypothetical protein NTV89_18150 [Proteobacteria bacterium]|nr:hypothetical protein [Pseudomonadota bacterium]